MTQPKLTACKPLAGAAPSWRCHISRRGACFMRGSIMAGCIMDCGRVVNRRERRAGFDGRRDYVRATWYATNHLYRYGVWLAATLDRRIAQGSRA